jgi:sialidase-1
MLANFTFKSLLLPLVCLLGAATIVSCERTYEVSGGTHDNPNGTGSGSNNLPYIFKERSEGYSCFRIPAIIRTKDGTLLAFAEARKQNCRDEGDIDLVVKRSTDGGQTWGPLQMVWDDGGNTCGNPSPVVDQNTGTVHLLMTWNLGEDNIGEINTGTSKDTRRVFLTRSTDEGKSWAAPTEITSSVKRPEWGWYATGPVHGIQLTKGAHAGRLVIPCDYIEVGPGRRGYSHVIYSDDAGTTWTIGGVCPDAGVNESTVAELSDGRLMLNMRSSNSIRRVATSSDGGLTFGGMYADHTLIEPICQGSLLSATVGNRHTLFFSNPASSTRHNMTLRLSTDDGATWPKKFTVHSGPSAYSDIVMVADDKVGIFYEGGTANPYQGIAFQVVPVSAIK